MSDKKLLVCEITSEEFEVVEDYTTIRAKSVMDGSETLSQAAGRLREYADELEEMEEDGWQLYMKIIDDYGDIRRHRKVPK